MTHPLTDAELHDKFNGYREEGWCNSIYDPDDMRTAADRQLEQIMKWIQDNLHGSYYLSPEGLHGYEIDTSDVIEDLKEAMRPQEDS